MTSHDQSTRHPKIDRAVAEQRALGGDDNLGISDKRNGESFRGEQVRTSSSLKSCHHWDQHPRADEPHAIRQQPKAAHDDGLLCAAE